MFGNCVVSRNWNTFLLVLLASQIFGVDIGMIFLMFFHLFLLW